MQNLENNTETQIYPPVQLQTLSERVKRACETAGWNELVPVQAQVFPYFVNKHDMMVQSKTGSGKTGAFLLPLLDLINVEKNETQILILVPTRELCKQVAKEAEILAECSNIRTVAVFGGVGYNQQTEAFKRGVHIVIGTPGRVLDHLLSRQLTINSLKAFILDEADRMLSMGFYQDMKKVQSYLPKQNVIKGLFSATFPPFVIGLSHEFLTNPIKLSMSHGVVHALEIDHAYYVVPAMQKDRALVRLLEVENPSRCIIFCNTKSVVHYVTVVLQRFGYPAEELSSDISQNMRDQVMEKLRAGNLRYLVTTDVAARGIDIPGLSHVIQYEPSEDPELYIHRSGRTGRQGAAGIAWTLVNPLEESGLKQTAKRYEIAITKRALPTDEEMQLILIERITAALETKMRELDSIQSEQMRPFITIAKQLTEQQPECIAMLLDECYQRSIHAQHEPTDKQTEAASKPKSRSRKKRKS